LIEAPHEIDVLPESQSLVKSAHCIKGIDPDDERRSRHVAHPAPGLDAGRFGSEVERGALVADNPRRYEANLGVIEVWKELVEPAGSTVGRHFVVE
jgi:hypothetical protein